MFEIHILKYDEFLRQEMKYRQEKGSYQQARDEYCQDNYG